MKKISLLLFMLLMSSCSSLIENAALNTTGNLVYKTTFSFEEETDWDLAKDGFPGTIKFVEGMYFLDPENEDLLAALVKAYSGYAFSIFETIYFENKLLGQDEGSTSLENAKINYSKAISYGLKYLEMKGITYRNLIDANSTQGGIPALLNEKLGDDAKEIDVMFYFAQGLGSYVNLNKESMIQVAQLPIAKGTFDWVCAKKPDYGFGACEIFYGTYETSRPPMLGGNPEKGKKIFEKGIEKYPNNWLIKMAFLEQYIIPQADEENFEKYMTEMEENRAQFRQFQTWSFNREESPVFKEKALRFFQAIAVKRYDILTSVESEVI